MNREKLLRFAGNSGERLLLSRLADKAQKADATVTCTWSHFLDPHQRSMAEKAFAACPPDGGIELRFDGGYEDAERTLAGFVPEVEWDLDDEPPLVLLGAKTSGRGGGRPLTHRDWLGALMGLGIKRETVGDILVTPDGASLFVMEDVSAFILTQLEQVGAETVTVTPGDPEALILPERKEREIRGTVMSMRLDAVAALAFSVSRTRMAEWIRAEKLSLDWEVQTNPAKAVREGSMLSLRGRGRAMVEAVGGVSRKGRTGVVIRRLV